MSIYSGDEDCGDEITSPSDADHEFLAERETDALEEAKAGAWERRRAGGGPIPRPGDWRIVQEEGSWYVRVVAPYPDDLYVCRLSAWGPPGSGDLIAAAPEYHEEAHRLAMLVLQSNLYAKVPDMRELVDSILAIYAKVEGRS